MSIGADNFLGNNIAYPAQGRTGDNCPFATKVMVPDRRPVRSGVTARLAQLRDPALGERDTGLELPPAEPRRRLASKNVHNAGSIVLRLLVRWLHLAGVLVLTTGAFDLSRTYGCGRSCRSRPRSCCSRSSTTRSSSGPPSTCRLSPRNVPDLRPHRSGGTSGPEGPLPSQNFPAFDGTPFKCVLWRLLGVRIGCRVFGRLSPSPNGPSLPSATAARSTPGASSKVPPRRRTARLVRPDRARPGVTLSGWPRSCITACNVGDGSVLAAADSFLMKGEEVPAWAHWGGNPAARSGRTGTRPPPSPRHRHCPHRPRSSGLPDGRPDPPVRRGPPDDRPARTPRPCPHRPPRLACPRRPRPRPARHSPRHSPAGPALLPRPPPGARTRRPSHRPAPRCRSHRARPFLPARTGGHAAAPGPARRNPAAGPTALRTCPRQHLATLSLAPVARPAPRPDPPAEHRPGPRYRGARRPAARVPGRLRPAGVPAEAALLAAHARVLAALSGSRRSSLHPRRAWSRCPGGSTPVFRPGGLSSRPRPAVDGPGRHPVRDPARPGWDGGEPTATSYRPWALSGDAGPPVLRLRYRTDVIDADCAARLGATTRRRSTPCPPTDAAPGGGTCRPPRSCATSWRTSTVRPGASVFGPPAPMSCSSSGWPRTRRRSPLSSATPGDLPRAQRLANRLGCAPADRGLASRTRSRW
ncbi:hypothetical protein HBB16_16685 [Pseudonocardia sp. MCCB 268]|nr:hypothetical protein [Pseudonocardia cytotoxica]